MSHIKAICLAIVRKECAAHKKCQWSLTTIFIKCIQIYPNSTYMCHGQTLDDVIFVPVLGGGGHQFINIGLYIPSISLYKDSNHKISDSAMDWSSWVQPIWITGVFSGNSLFFICFPPMEPQNIVFQCFCHVGISFHIPYNIYTTHHIYIYTNIHTNYHYIYIYPYTYQLSLYIYIYPYTYQLSLNSSCFLFLMASVVVPFNDGSAVSDSPDS